MGELMGFYICEYCKEKKFNPRSKKGEYTRKYCCLAHSQAAFKERHKIDKHKGLKNTIS